MAASSFSGTVADIFASLGLDSTQFHADLAAARVGFITAADDMALPVGKINTLLNQLRTKISPTATSSLITQLTAQGYTLADAMHLAYAAIAEVEQANRERVAEEKEATEQMAAREVEYTRLWKRLLVERDEAEKASVEQRVAAENFVFSEVIAQGRIREALRKKELALQLADEKAAAAERVAIERAATSEIANGAYLLGGYGAARTARGITSTMGPVLGAVAIIGATYELGKWTLEAEKAAQKTANFANELNITWKEARQFEELATIAGVSVSTLAQASGRLAVGLDSSSSAGKDVAKALKEMGVEGNSSGELLTNFLQKLSEIPDASLRIAEARRVIGRGSPDIEALVSNLDKLKSKLATLGPAMKSDLGDKLAEAAVSMGLLEVSWARFKANLAVTLSPGLTKLLDYLSQSMSGQSEGDKGLAGLAKDNLGARGGGIVAALLAKAAWDDYHKTRNEVNVAEIEYDSEEKDRLILNLRAVDAYNKEHGKTLDGAKEELKETKDLIAEKDKLLKRSANPLDISERPQVEQELRQAEARKAELEKLIRDLEGKTAKAEAAAQKHAETLARKQEQESLALEGAKNSYLRFAEDVGHALDAMGDATRQHMIDLMTGINDLINSEAPANVIHGAIAQAQTELRGVMITLREIKADTALEDKLAKSKLALGKSDEELAKLSANAYKKSIEAGGTKYSPTGEPETTNIEGKFGGRHGISQFEKASDFARTLSLLPPQFADMVSKVHDIEGEFKQLGLTSKESLNRTSLEAQIAYERLVQLKAPIYDLAQAWVKLIEDRSKALGVSPSTTAGYLEAKAGLNSRGLMDPTDTARLAELTKQNNLEDSEGLSRRLVGLTNLKIQTKALEVVTRGIGGVYEDVANEAEKEFGRIGAGLAGLITDGKKGGANLRNILKSAERDVLATLFQHAIELGVGKVITLVTHGGGQTAQVVLVATIKAQTVAEQGNTTALAANTSAEELNTTALTSNTSAIYALIAALHQAQLGGMGAGKSAVNGLTGGLGHGFGQVAGGILAKILGGALGASKFFADGGDVSDTGLHHLDRGEHVLTPSISKGLREMIGRPQRGGQGDTHNIYLTTYGHHSASEIDEIGDKLVKRMRRTGGVS